RWFSFRIVSRQPPRFEAPKRSSTIASSESTGDRKATHRTVNDQAIWVVVAARKDDRSVPDTTLPAMAACQVTRLSVGRISTSLKVPPLLLLLLPVRKSPGTKTP